MDEHRTAAAPKRTQSDEKCSMEEAGRGGERAEWTETEQIEVERLAESYLTLSINQR